MDPLPSIAEDDEAVGLDAGLDQLAETGNAEARSDVGGAVALAGCSSKEPLEPFVEIRAEQSYNAGIAYLQQGDYKNATKKFQEVDEQHPYSEWARKSLIMTTYTNYTRGNFTEAITQAKRYLALYPGSEDAAYAQWMIAQSYFNQMPDITRDQKATQQAMQAMQELVDRYPDSQYAAEGRKRLDIAAKGFAAIIFIGFASIPAAVLAKVVKADTTAGAAPIINLSK